MKFEFEAELWKGKSKEFYIRLIELDQKAEDSGLTKEEQEEYKLLETKTSEELQNFLKAIKLL